MTTQQATTNVPAGQGQDKGHQLLYTPMQRQAGRRRGRSHVAGEGLAAEDGVVAVAGRPVEASAGAAAQLRQLVGQPLHVLPQGLLVGHDGFIAGQLPLQPALLQLHHHRHSFHANITLGSLLRQVFVVKGHQFIKESSLLEELQCRHAK